MAKQRKKIRKSPQKKQQKKSSSKSVFWIILGISLIISSLFLGYFYKDKIIFYYSLYFQKNKPKKLTNTPFESRRIQKIIEKNMGKTFGLDISHYQEKRDIDWDNLTLINGSIPLNFIVLRATMGNNSQDKNFNYFWKKAKEKQLLRGAYHFYRPDEDPVLQAHSYLKTVKLTSGDLLPVLDIEKMPLKKTKEQYLKEVQIWLDIVEKAYGKKPIIYTYYHFYKDYLRGKLDQYPLWLANYNDVSAPSDTDTWKIWQFTENGISDGVNAKIDLNIYNGSLWEMRELQID